MSDQSEYDMHMIYAMIYATGYDIHISLLYSYSTYDEQ